MRHARPEDLDVLEPVLVQLRRLGSLREKRRGVFYRGSTAFLHFHEHGGELFADIRTGADFERMRVMTPAEQRRVVGIVQSAL